MFDADVNNIVKSGELMHRSEERIAEMRLRR